MILLDHLLGQRASFGPVYLLYDFPRGASGKEPACQCRWLERLQLIPGSGRSPGGGHGNPLQYSCLENPMDRGAHGQRSGYCPQGLTELDTTEQLSTQQLHLPYTDYFCIFDPLEKNHEDNMTSTKSHILWMEKLKLRETRGYMQSPRADQRLSQDWESVKNVKLKCFSASAQPQ